MTLDDPEDTHVYPTRDRQPHLYTRMCWCQPTVEDIEDSYEKIVVHHSADGREEFEGQLSGIGEVHH